MNVILVRIPTMTPILYVIFVLSSGMLAIDAASPWATKKIISERNPKVVNWAMTPANIPYMNTTLSKDDASSLSLWDLLVGRSPPGCSLTPDSRMKGRFSGGEFKKKNRKYSTNPKSLVYNREFNARFKSNVRNNGSPMVVKLFLILSFTRPVFEPF